MITETNLHKLWKYKSYMVFFPHSCEFVGPKAVLRFLAAVAVLPGECFAKSWTFFFQTEAARHILCCTIILQLHCASFISVSSCNYLYIVRKSYFESDDEYMIRDIALSIGISLSRVHLFEVYICNYEIPSHILPDTK